MFRVVLLMKDDSEFTKFTDAYKHFHKKIVEAIKSGGMNQQVLETTNFIVLCYGHTKLPMDFCDARDFAYDIGLLAGRGELQEGVAEPSEGVVRAAYQKVALNYMAGQTRELIDVLKATSIVASTL